MNKIKIEKDEIKEAYKNLHAGSIPEITAKGSWYKKIEIEMPDGSKKLVPTGRFVDSSIDHPIHRVGFEKHWEKANLRKDLTKTKFFPGQNNFSDIEIEYV